VANRKSLQNTRLVAATKAADDLDRGTPKMPLSGGSLVRIRVGQCSGMTPELEARLEFLSLAAAKVCEG